ncbi:MAG: hypothetical protein M3361_04285, partial [Candidatus Tectomicrobia bacterium]|nr:hypothetical protein [Candidatus Tectomicrobia bacterium]
VIRHRAWSPSHPPETVAGIFSCAAPVILAATIGALTTNLVSRLPVADKVANFGAPHSGAG